MYFIVSVPHSKADKFASLNRENNIQFGYIKSDGHTLDAPDILEEYTDIIWDDGTAKYSRKGIKNIVGERLLETIANDVQAMKKACQCSWDTTVVENKIFVRATSPVLTKNGMCYGAGADTHRISYNDLENIITIGLLEDRYKIREELLQILQ